MGFFNDDERQLIRQHEFSIDCLSMKLSQKGGGTATYTGAGQIRQTPDGHIEVVLYDTVARRDLDDLLRSKPVGVFLTDKEFFRLEAVDLRGSLWTADWVHIAISPGARQPGLIIRAQIDELVTTSDAPPAAAGFIAFTPAAVGLPLNMYTETITKRDDGESKGVRLDTWAVGIEGLGILRVRRLESGLDIDFDSADGTLPDEFDVRLMEGLGFVLGQPIKWLEYQLLQKGTLRKVIRTAPRQHGRPRLQPPVANRSLRTEPGELFATVLTHLVATAPPPDEYHPLAASIHRVLRASASDIEDEVLVLGVEVERLVRDFCLAKAPVPDSVREAVAKARIEIEKWGSEVATRLLGYLPTLTQPSPLAILRTLESERVLRADHVSAWRKARNREAHGGRSTDAIEKLVAESDMVYQAYLLIIFSIVGYDGRFSDHTKPRWPLVSQPRIAALEGASPVASAAEKAKES